MSETEWSSAEYIWICSNVSAEKQKQEPTSLIFFKQQIYKCITCMISKPMYRYGPPLQLAGLHVHPGAIALGQGWSLGVTKSMTSTCQSWAVTKKTGRLVVIRGLYDLLSWGLLYIILDIPCPTSKFKTLTKRIWTLLTWWYLNIWNPKSNMCHFSGSRYPKFEKHLVKCGLCLLVVGPHQLVRSFHV